MLAFREINQHFDGDYNKIVLENPGTLPVSELQLKKQGLCAN